MPTTTTPTAPTTTTPTAPTTTTALTAQTTATTTDELQPPTPPFPVNNRFEEGIGIGAAIVTGITIIGLIILCVVLYYRKRKCQQSNMYLTPVSHVPGNVHYAVPVAGDPNNYAELGYRDPDDTADYEDLKTYVNLDGKLPSK